MRKLQFIGLTIIILLSLIATSCSDNDNKIKVSVWNVNVRKNLEQTIKISGGTGIYTCEIDDNEIASAKISGQILTITGQNTGITYLTINDGVNTSVTITIKVLHQKILCEITGVESKIEIGKDEYYNLIIEELQEYFPFPVGTRYELIIKSEITDIKGPDIIKGNLLIYYNTQNDSFDGEFELYGDLLTLSYLGQTYKYVIDAGREHWLISEILTEHYKKKYPEADIRYIYNNQILKVLSGSL